MRERNIKDVVGTPYQRVKALAYERGMTLKEVADASGIAPITLTRWDGRNKPRRSCIELVAAVLSVDPAELMPDEKI